MISWTLAEKPLSFFAFLQIILPRIFIECSVSMHVSRMDWMQICLSFCHRVSNWPLYNWRSKLSGKNAQKRSNQTAISGNLWFLKNDLQVRVIIRRPKLSREENSNILRHRVYSGPKTPKMNRFAVLKDVLLAQKPGNTFPSLETFSLEGDEEWMSDSRRISRASGAIWFDKIRTREWLSCFL